MSDSAFFSTGALFSTDYLGQAIKDTAAYRAVDVAALRARLDAIAAAFHQNARTNESQTEDDFIWVTQAICDVAEAHSGGRVVSTLEGGYDLEALAASAAAHVQVLMERGA